MISKFVKANCIILLILASGVANADALGFASGRSVNFDRIGSVSAELGGHYGGDGDFGGLRINFKVTPKTVLFVNVGQLSISNDEFDITASGKAFGGGFIRSRETVDGNNLALKGSFNIASVALENCEASLLAAVNKQLAASGRPTINLSQLNMIRDTSIVCDDETELQELAFEWVASNDQIGNSRFGWYVNSGIHLLFSNDELFSEFAVGAGATGSVSRFDFYAGLDFVDDFYLVTCIRINY